MGGRGSTSGGMTGGAGNNERPSAVTDLISQREGKRAEVDQVLTVLNDYYERYGVQVDTDVATFSRQNGTMAYYAADGTLGVNSAYFDADKMSRAYDRNVESGFHPSRGNKTGLEAVTAHEMGHRLTDVAAQRAGYGDWQLDRISNEVVREAARRMNKSVENVRRSISGYAAQGGNAEAIAEAFSDVYCNGGNAKLESRYVFQILRGRLG